MLHIGQQAYHKCKRHDFETPKSHDLPLILLCLTISLFCLLKCKHVPFDISMLNNTFFLHINRKTIISITQLCYAKCNTFKNYWLPKVTYDK